MSTQTMKYNTCTSDNCIHINGIKIRLHIYIEYMAVVSNIFKFTVMYMRMLSY